MFININSHGSKTQELSCFWFQLFIHRTQFAREISSLLKVKEITGDKECKPSRFSKTFVWMVLLLAKQKSQNSDQSFKFQVRCVSQSQGQNCTSRIHTIITQEPEIRQLIATRNKESGLLLKSSCSLLLLIEAFTLLHSKEPHRISFSCFLLYLPSAGAGRPLIFIIILLLLFRWCLCLIRWLLASCLLRLMFHIFRWRKLFKFRIKTTMEMVSSYNQYDALFKQTVKIMDSIWLHIMVYHKTVIIDGLNQVQWLLP